MTQISIKCDYCHSDFFRSLKDFNKANKWGYKTQYCSHDCRAQARKVKRVPIPCGKCGKEILKTEAELKLQPKYYCSIKCGVNGSLEYRKKPSPSKKSGSQRSKLEIYIGDKLLQKFPTLEIHFNRRDAINAELDIYIPSLKLAIELNGIFHYEPIFGEEKLKQTKTNDARKIQACIENNISFCIIDISRTGTFKESKAVPYLNIVEETILRHLNMEIGEGSIYP